MRPSRFPQQPQVQPAGSRVPLNQHVVINHLLQQQQLMQQQQRVLQQQNTGLNAAIRDLQQRSIQNHHHPLSHHGTPPVVRPCIPTNHPLRPPMPGPFFSHAPKPIPTGVQKGIVPNSGGQTSNSQLPPTKTNAGELMSGEWRPIENTYRPRSHYESKTQSKVNEAGASGYGAKTGNRYDRDGRVHHPERTQSDERTRSRETKGAYKDSRNTSFDGSSKEGERGYYQERTHSEEYRRNPTNNCDRVDGRRQDGGSQSGREPSKERREYKGYGNERGRGMGHQDPNSFSRSRSEGSRGRGVNPGVEIPGRERFNNYRDGESDRSSSNSRMGDYSRYADRGRSYDRGKESNTDGRMRSKDTRPNETNDKNSGLRYNNVYKEPSNSNPYKDNGDRKGRFHYSEERSRSRDDKQAEYVKGRDDSREIYDRSYDRHKIGRDWSDRRPYSVTRNGGDGQERREDDRRSYSRHPERKRKRWGDDDSDRKGDNSSKLSNNEREGSVTSSSKRMNDDDSDLSQYRQDLLKMGMEELSDDETLPSDLKFTDNELQSDDEWDLDAELKQEEEDKTEYVIRSCPADLYFNRDEETGNIEATKKMVDLEHKFEEEVVKRAEKIRSSLPESEVALPPPPPPTAHIHTHKCNHGKKEESSSCDSSSSSDGDLSDDDDDDENPPNPMMEEWERKSKHPLCLHRELWYNEPGRVNDGPLCRCSLKSRKSGIRHDIYPGEDTIPKCNMNSNNLNQLYHYRITMSPFVNFLSKTPTLIIYDDHEYIFEGFSIFTHTPLENVPPCKLLRFNIAYTILLIPEDPPENFTVSSLDMFSDFIFTEILEMMDLDWGVKDGGCRRFHFMPRFCRHLPDSSCKELLSMNHVLNYLLKSSKPLVSKSKLSEMENFSDDKWRSWIGSVRGMIVTKPSMKPSSIRIDQLDRKNHSSPTNQATSSKSDSKPPTPEQNDTDPRYPLIIHQSYRPAQLSYAGDPSYRRVWRSYIKFRRLVNSKPEVNPKDRQKLKIMEENLKNIRVKKTMKREVTVELSSEDFLCTGLRADLCQHALMIPVLVSHLRFHISLRVLEDIIGYQFKDRNLLQLSLTHSSYRTNFGINPDHTRNSLTNCGMRQLTYGNRSIHHQHTQKRGICILLDIMARYGKQEDTVSEVPHNERLEFLGDAVIEFLSSIHLFFLFPWLQEGALSTYRMALVQNQHLPLLARKLRLHDFMLYIHGPDLCMQSEFKHAMANCFEALMGALYLDADMETVDEIYARALFDDDPILLDTWKDVPQHVLQQAEPGGDRHWIKSLPVLQKLEKFEESIGIKFTHIRLLAKAFTHRNIKHNPITLGHNQRLEYLGDTVLKLVTSEYLYRYYPEHHEGHLSLLRSSLVNNRTQATVFDDLAMGDYFIYDKDALMEMKTKQRADVLEAFVGALFVDKGLVYCWSFCNVCFFPRLKDFISNQKWNDPKSQLQQCCLTLREVGGGEPDIPVYKMIESIGPTNTRLYKVAVYFRGKRLATGTGHGIQHAEMDAAANAMNNRTDLMPILQHQRRYLERCKLGMFGKQDDDENSDDSSSAGPSQKKRRRGKGKSRSSTK